MLKIKAIALILELVILVTSAQGQEEPLNWKIVGPPEEPALSSSAAPRLDFRIVGRPPAVYQLQAAPQQTNDRAKTDSCECKPGEDCLCGPGCKCHSAETLFRAMPDYWVVANTADDTWVCGPCEHDKQTLFPQLERLGFDFGRDILIRPGRDLTRGYPSYELYDKSVSVTEPIDTHRGSMSYAQFRAFIRPVQLKYRQTNLTRRQ